MSDWEQQACVGDVKELILSSGQRAVLLRKTEGEHLYGSDDDILTELGEHPLELSETPPEDLSKDIDATACVLPGLDVRAEDRVRFADVYYRVQTVTPQLLFGVETHKVLELVKLYGS